MVFFFCSMKTRVTLETPMPPSTSTTSPVKREIVLRARELLAQILLRVLVGADVDELPLRARARRLSNDSFQRSVLQS